jgi:hypothetical protein
MTPDAKRNVQLQVLLTPGEYDGFAIDAIRARMTVSTYVRAFLKAARDAGVSIVAKHESASTV